MNYGIILFSIIFTMSLVHFAHLQRYVSKRTRPYVEESSSRSVVRNEAPVLVYSNDNENEYRNVQRASGNRILVLENEEILPIGGRRETFEVEDRLLVLPNTG